MPLRSFSLAVVGSDYPNRRGPTRREGIALCNPGDPITLQREPDNPADERAVAVFNDRKIQLGYLTAERAAWIGGMLSSSRKLTAIFQSAAPYGALIRIAFDGDLPELPRLQEQKPGHTEQEFWPDPTYPDD